MSLITEYNRTLFLLAKTKPALTLADKLKVMGLFVKNVMEYYPEKSSYKIGMVTYVQLVGCYKLTGKFMVVNIDRSLIRGSKMAVDRVSD